MTDVQNLMFVGMTDMTGRVIKIPYCVLAGLAAAGVQNLLISASNYQVTATKTFTVTAIIQQSQGNATPGGVTPIYADDAALTTNVVQSTCATVGNPAAFNGITLPCNFVIPAGKYVGLKNNVGANAFGYISLVGYES
jgi:hypothetical protein